MDEAVSLIIVTGLLNFLCVRPCVRACPFVCARQSTGGGRNGECGAHRARTSTETARLHRGGGGGGGAGWGALCLHRASPGLMH